MTGISVPFEIISDIFKILTVVIILGSLYYMYTRPKTLALMLKLIFLSLMVTIFFSQYRSPQYIVWFSPIAAILVADDIWGIAMFICVQIAGFIEFPLAFYKIYVNDHYTSSLALGFFTVVFILYGLLVWRALIMREGVISSEKKTPKKTRPNRG